MRIVLTSLVPALLTGCIVYDNDGPHDGDRDDRDGATEDVDRDDNGVTEGPDEPAAVFAFEPSEAEVGDAFIGYLSVVEGDVDLRDASDVVVYGDLQLADWDVRSDELILAVAIDEQAQPGVVDILIEIDGQAFVVEAALEVFASDSGHSVEDQEQDEEGLDDPGDNSDDCD